MVSLSLSLFVKKECKCVISYSTGRVYQYRLFGLIGSVRPCLLLLEIKIYYCNLMRMWNKKVNWWRRRRIGICLFCRFCQKTHECLQQIALREPAILFFCLQNIKELHSPLPFTITVAPAYVLFVLHVVYTWINFNSDFCDVKIYAHWWFLWRHNLRALFVDRWLYTISQLFLLSSSVHRSLFGVAIHDWEFRNECVKVAL